MKVTFESLKDKEEIMHNLRNLKGKEEFKKLNIRDDYTITERNMIKEFGMKVKEKNEAEKETSRVVWKIRGNPKSGLYMKKIEINKNVQNVENIENTKYNEDESLDDARTNGESPTQCTKKLVYYDNLQ